MTYFVTQRNGIRAVTDRLPDTGVEGSFRRMEDAFAYLQRQDARERRTAIVATTLLYTVAIGLCGYLIGSLPESEPRPVHEIVQSESWEPDYARPEFGARSVVVEPCRLHPVHGCID